ncbi:sulfite exporter TauE/SafE family protein [Geobacillus stearothermophilus]|uniref:sulfite exporter TauE/SafE family protein n=1 Tax=Geobacillus stearothermophilus TaxID=1422 RepID=UPI0024026E3C|nr:sulfite exporter TauE/SafE family protein [Geobacillus stearothermophilus]MDF9297713.1 sulfite exporter TauE/SafE family protein [Geobacillus stearothermophilus]
MAYALLVLIGFIAGSLGSLAGLGGGVVIVPSLLFFGALGWLSAVTPQVAVGTSLVVIIFNGLSSTLSYMKDKMVDYPSGLLFCIGSVPGAVIGAWVNNTLSAAHFSLYFGLFLIAMSVFLSLSQKKTKRSADETAAATENERESSRSETKAETRLKRASWWARKVMRTYTERNGETFVYGYYPLAAIAIAFVVGFFGGLFGIGGGSLMVPAMIVLFRFPPHVAVATSMLMIFLSSLIGSLTHVAMGNVQWPFALALIPGVWIGAKTGAWINKRMPSRTLVVVLRLVLVLLGARLVWESLA